MKKVGDYQRYNIYSSSEKLLHLSHFPLSLLTNINQKWKC